MRFIRLLLAKLFIAVSLLVTTNAHAGIPVIDSANIAQAINTFNQLRAQYNLLTNQFNQLKTITDIATGNRSFGDILNDPNIKSKLPADWSNALTSIKGSDTYKAIRKTLPNSTNSSLNAAYDQQAVSSAAMNDFYSQTQARVSQLSSLMSLLNTTTDQAGKLDLANKLQHTQAEIQASNQLFAVLNQRLQSDQQAADQAAFSNRVCQEFKKPGC